MKYIAFALGPYNSMLSFPSPARIMILDPHCQTDNLKIIHYFGETHLKSCFPRGGLLKFGFGRDVPPRNLKVDPYKYQFFKKK